MAERPTAPLEADRRLAVTSTGLLREFNLAGVLSAADVHVARRLGLLGGEDDERVLLAAALGVRAVRAGSVCLELGTVADTLGDEGASWTGDPDRAAPDRLSWPAPQVWEQAVLASPLVEAGVLRWEQGALYLDRYWRQESQVVDDLTRRSAAVPPPVDERVLAEALGTYFPDDRYADQRAAAETACRHWTSVVTGGPGTGKTTTVARLIAVLLALHGDAPGRRLRIALAAPTGKAAARMAQAVRDATMQPGFPGAGAGAGAGAGDPAEDRRAVIQGLDAVTLHRLLGSRPDNRTRFRHHRGNRLPHDVVIVDETSMVSLTMMARLLEAVRPEARLVLVGDADQLASVDAGAVLKDLVDGFTRPEGAAGPVSRLSASRRFGERIGELASAVRDGDVDRALAALRDGGDEVVWLPSEELPGLLGRRVTALHAAAQSGDHAAALQAHGHHRLLCAHRDGPYGVAEWNRTVERLLMQATGRDWLPDWYVGQPLIFNANDYGLGLFNGDTGLVCSAPEEPGGRVAVIDAGDGASGRRLATTRLGDVSTAHAMTVHRSQGSQFDEVTVLLPEPDSRILTRELFYTAVTRARSVVRVVGSEEAVRAAVERRARRATGLARRLGAPMDAEVNDH